MFFTQTFSCIRVSGRVVSEHVFNNKIVRPIYHQVFIKISVSERSDENQHFIIVKPQLIG